MKGLFISRDYSNLDDGGKVVTKRNADLLKALGISLTELYKRPNSLVSLFTNFILRRDYGGNVEMTRQFRQLLESDKFDFVWFDGSLNNHLVAECKRRGLPVITFYHNIELLFYESKARTTKRILDRLFIPYIRGLEKKNTELTDYCICLNSRDSEKLKEVYGREADLVLTTSFPLQPEREIRKQENSVEKYLLFVGSGFWANIEGLNYFIKEIAPGIPYKLKIIGSVCEAFNNTELPNNIELLGKVKDLDPYYAGALAVVSPILSGSGTKTKTIEAMRYGKAIIGSQEAFAGLPYVGKTEGLVLCKATKDYIEAINSLGEVKFHKSVYNRFVEEHSDDAMRKKLMDFFRRHVIGHVKSI